MAKRKKRGAPQKTCPKCKQTNHAKRKTCEQCGFEFPQKTKPARPRRKPLQAAGEATDIISAAGDFIKTAGGYDKAREVIDAFQKANAPS